ncbi:hypothetical protein ABXJ76_18950 [Methylobacter sp. G7]|uniref:hypothetical protein n=1 Tax=Methylobacter sp. G7 TaxID=3230117 RepID=UPI003D803D4C
MYCAHQRLNRSPDPVQHLGWLRKKVLSTPNKVLRANRHIDIAAAGWPIKEPSEKKSSAGINKSSVMSSRQMIDPVTGTVTGLVIVPVGGCRPIAAAVETMPNLGFTQRRIVHTVDLGVPMRRRPVICHDGLLTE